MEHSLSPWAKKKQTKGWVTPGTLVQLLLSEASTDICWRQNLSVVHFLDAHFKFSVKKKHRRDSGTIYITPPFNLWGKFYACNSKKLSLSTKLVCFHLWVYRINPALYEKQTQITATYTPSIHSPRKTGCVKWRDGIWSSVLFQMKGGLE